MGVRIERCKRLTSVGIINQRVEIRCLRLLLLCVGEARRFDTTFFRIWPVPFTVGAVPEVKVHAVGAVDIVAVFTLMLRQPVTAAILAVSLLLLLIPVCKVGGPRWPVRLAGTKIRQPSPRWSVRRAGIGTHGS